MKLLILGAGKMGKGAAFDLVRQPDVLEVVLADKYLEQAQRIAKEVDGDIIKPVQFDADDEKRIRELMEGTSAVIGATSYEHNLLYSRLAIEAKTNFIDLGGNHDVVDKQFDMSDKAKEAGIAIMPDCGLAPGLVNILSGRSMEKFDEVESIQIRVGGIPVDPKPPLNYFLVFSARGLINEYIEKARIIKDGKIMEVDSLDGLECLHFQDPFGEMEAFYTSGGISTLTKTLKGKVKNLDYKTIRYPGHQHYIKFLVDLGFTSSDALQVNGCTAVPRQVLEKLLERNLEFDGSDSILIRVVSKGKRHGIETIYTQEIIDFADKENKLTSMMRMTSFPAAILALMLARGDIKDKGTLYQEESVPFDVFFNELEKRKISISTRKQQL